MKRSKSVTSLSKMCQFPNDYEIGYEQNDASLTQRDIENMNQILDDGSMPFPIPDNQLGVVPPNSEEYLSSTSDSDNDVPVVLSTEEELPCFTKCKASDLKATLSTIYNFSGNGQFSKWLNDKPGLLMLPIRNASLIRKAHGHHITDVPIIIFHPRNQIQYSNWPILEEAINVLK